MKGLQGWHFLAGDRRLRYPLPDGSRPVVEEGQTLRVKGPVRLCEWGLHASALALDALSYTNHLDGRSVVVCRVMLGGDIVYGRDKAVATERTCLWWADATNVLYSFAVDCAKGVLLAERAAGREPDRRSWAVLEVKRRWLRGEATDEELRAAAEAAWAAAATVYDAAAAWVVATAAAPAAWTSAVCATDAAGRAAAWAAAAHATSAAYYAALCACEATYYSACAAIGQADDATVWPAEWRRQSARLEERLWALAPPGDSERARTML